MATTVKNAKDVKDVKDVSAESFRIHPECLKYPAMSKQDYRELADSLRARGYNPDYPILWWEDQTGQKWILDGRHRHMLCLSLDLDPVYKEYTGAAKDIPSVVYEANQARRHMTAAEKAQIAKDRRDTVERCYRDGMSVREIATEQGTSPATIHRDIVHLRSAGLLPTPKEEQEQEEAEAEQIATQVDKAVGTGEEAPVPTRVQERQHRGPLSPVKDRLGTTIPKSMLDNFAGEVWDQYHADLNSMLTALESMHRQWCPYLDIPAIQVAIESLQNHLKRARPYAIHQGCKGQGCSACMKCGWAPEHLYNDMTLKGEWMIDPRGKNGHRKKGGKRA